MRGPIDEYLPKIEELVVRSNSNIRADVAHKRITAMGFTGGERTTRRVVAQVKAQLRAGQRRVFRPCVLTELPELSGSFALWTEGGAAKFCFEVSDAVAALRGATRSTGTAIRRAGDQPVKTASGRSEAVRQTCCPLRSHDPCRRDQSMAAALVRTEPRAASPLREPSAVDRATDTAVRCADRQSWVRRPVPVWGAARSSVRGRWGRGASARRRALWAPAGPRPQAGTAARIRRQRRRTSASPR